MVKNGPETGPWISISLFFTVRRKPNLKEKPVLRPAVKNSPIGLVVKNELHAHGEESELALRG